ncbi:MAG: hypothetical protein LQ348_004465 [Seirophora lacunosa]|nr:MAG: hypothetical protein LQ348_004465 [Seirophora lacunosa]
MALPRTDLSIRQRAPNYGVLLEDPFFSDTNRSTSSRGSGLVLTPPADSGQDTDSGASKTVTSRIFGHAPFHKRVSSSVRLPSSPSSKNLKEIRALQKSPSYRASSSSLNANAAPFQPQHTPPSSEGADKRSFSYPMSMHDAHGQRRSRMDERYDPPVIISQAGDHLLQTSGPATYVLSQTPLWQSTDRPSPAFRLARKTKFHLPLNGGRFTTPSNPRHRRPALKDKRRRAFSDEPSLYNHPRARLTATPTRQHVSEVTQSESRIPHFSRPPAGSDSIFSDDSWSALEPANNIARLRTGGALTDYKSASGTLNRMGQGSLQGDQNGDASQPSIFDYTPTPPVPNHNHSAPQNQINPYTQEGNAIGSATYFPGSTNFPQQLQHHLYAALPPHRDLSQPNQRTAKDFFIPEDLRQTLARKSETALMTFPNSTLPPNIAHYHSLVPLVHNIQNDAATFGYPNQAYKATSALDGKLYCLRRLSGYRLNEASSEHAIRNVGPNWKRVRSGNVVSVHLAFTNSGFGDSSLIFVTDYHPMAETLAQRHFSPSSRFSNRYSSALIPEHVLWGYIVQIASALKAIHSTGLAARVLDANKVLLTGENRVRLNGCAVFDVVQAESPHPLSDNQRLDLYLFGRLILTLGSNNTSQHSQGKALDAFGKSYTPRLKEVTTWLLDHLSPQRNDGIDAFLTLITNDIVTTFDNSLHQDDALESALTQELENSRMVRLLTKMNFINERPEYEHDRQWAEHGSRYCIKLFRDYVFHPVDPQGNPVLDMGHVVSCLNKLDAGIEEKIQLTTRDEETIIFLSYKELKACIESAWQDLMRRAA